MNTIVDNTKLRKKISTYKIVDVESEIDNIVSSPETGKETWTRNAEILVYDSSNKKPKTPLAIVMALMYKESNKYYRKAEKTSHKLYTGMPKIFNVNDKVSKSYHPVEKAYIRTQMDMFWFCLDMMLLEVKNTMMHIALNK